MKYIFNDKIKRLELYKIKNLSCNLIKIAVHRNHNFENIANIINPFLAESDLIANFSFSDYDDSLNFQIKDADIHIIWLDISRYKNINIVPFLIERLTYLRSLTSKPIILFYIGEDLNINTNNIINCYVKNCLDYLINLKNEIYDLDKEKYSGTKLSDKACIKLAQIIGLKYIPAFFNTSLKAIILDLDNTLYQGILGEDGIENLDITNDFLKLQKYIKSLKEKGFLICLATKNNEEDVYCLFNQRKDMILKIDDFTAIKANWKNKAENIKELSQIMNIGLDSILFIDDNPAEINNIEMIYPSIKTILATNPIQTLQQLELYPGLLKLSISKEDILRSNDLKANQIRETLLTKYDETEYFKKLQIELTFEINNKNSINRITELFNKTNQFILNYKRYSLNEVEKLMTQNSTIIISVKMQDILSESGIIALFSGHKNNNKLVVDEITISCRALGRNIESLIINKFIEIAIKQLNISNLVDIYWKKGPRNIPAIIELEKFLGYKLTNNSGVENIIYKNKTQINEIKITIKEDLTCTKI